MFDPHVLRRTRSIATVAFASALVVAACGGATASVTPSATPPAATPTSAPTPSPTPLDVSAAFVKIISAEDFSGKASLTGTLRSGAVEGDITGAFAGNAANSSSTTTITIGTFKQVTDKISVGDKRWTRTSPGPWLEDPAKPAGSSNKSLADTLRGLGAVVDLGVESHGGQQLHHLQPKGGNKLTAEEVGFDVDGATDGQFTLDFHATEDGTPAMMEVTGSWTQVSGGASVPTSVAVEYTFSDIGAPQIIDPPDDVWIRYTSKTLGYTMAHPADWTVEATKEKDSYALNGQPFVFVAVSPFKGSTAKFVAALKASYKAPFGGDPSSEAATSLGRVAAVRLIYEYRNEQDQDVIIADDIVSRDGTGWEVFLVTEGGTENVAFFDEFVSTFAFTE